MMQVVTKLKRDNNIKPQTVQNLLRQEGMQRRARRLQDAKLPEENIGNRVKTGSIVTTKTDYCDVFHPQGIPGILHHVSSRGAGGILVATKHDIISFT